MRPQKSTATVGPAGPVGPVGTAGTAGTVATVGAVATAPALATVDTSDYVGKHRPPRFSLHRGVRVSQLSERAEPAPSH